MLHGNVFNIVVRDLSKDTAEKALNFCKKNRFISFVNYYDSQRFGIPCSSFNTYLVGKAIIEGKWEEAFFLFKKTNNNSTVYDFPEKNLNDKNKFLNFFKSLDSKKISFFYCIL